MQNSPFLGFPLHLSNIYPIFSTEIPTMAKRPPQLVPLKKKQFGQNFLRKQSVVDAMVARVKPDNTTTIIEIGCGDGFLTETVLKKSPCKKVLVFEIDQEWIDVVQKKISDPRLKILHTNILDVDVESYLESNEPFTLLANLPYNITFPIFYKLHALRHRLTQGVVMVQEEVAQRLTAQTGRDAGFVSHFFQYFFELELMEKIEPAAFEPAPKVYSRLVYLKPRAAVQPVSDLEEYWKFLKLCYFSPRQMLRNNLKSTPYFERAQQVAPDILALRAQQISPHQFLTLWTQLHETN